MATERPSGVRFSITAHVPDKTLEPVPIDHILNNAGHHELVSTMPNLYQTRYPLSQTKQQRRLEALILWLSQPH